MQEQTKLSVMLAVLKLLLWLFGRWISFPVHDSWSPPKTPAERRLLRLRLSQLKPKFTGLSKPQVH